jgi:hypothetical protein
MDSSYLIGAYGMFWDRWSVEWSPGSGPAAWQLLGRVGSKAPKLRVCDFRLAQGFYILLDEHGANYVGLARGEYGIGARLQAHHLDESKAWSRFCWFSFDEVTEAERHGWASLQGREAVKNLSVETVLRECEALLIQILGSGRTIRLLHAEGRTRALKAQNEMNFLQADRWEQLRELDFQPGGVARRVDIDGYTDSWLRALARVEDT